MNYTATYAACIAFIIIVVIVLSIVVKIVGPFDLGGAYYSSKQMRIILYCYYEYDSIIPRFVPVNTKTNTVNMVDVVTNVIKNTKASRISFVYI